MRFPLLLMSLSRCPVSPCKEQANISILPMGRNTCRQPTSSNLSPATTAGGELLDGRPFVTTRKLFPLVISPMQAWTSEP